MPIVGQNNHIRKKLMEKLKLVIDSKIPFMHGFAEQLGEVQYISGADICAADVRDADVLIVRTRTHCNRELLEGSKVRFIATATIGFDHIDTDYLKEAGIAWTNCPGCNASSVAQYIESVLLLLNLHGCWDETRNFTPASSDIVAPAVDFSQFRKLTLGIVGVGNVGKEVLKKTENMGFKEILLCDPLRAEKEGAAGFVTLEEMAQRCDIVTFHTPLTQVPQPYPTFHLASDSFFTHLRPGAVVINSGRGEVFDTEALKKSLAEGRLRTAVIDTWEFEPHIDRQLLDSVFIGTPHIAGYSADGKANGTRMSLQAVARFFERDEAPFAAVCAPTLSPDYAYYPQSAAHVGVPQLRLYDPTRDSEALKLKPETFEHLRGDYPLRRECR